MKKTSTKTRTPAKNQAEPAVPVAPPRRVAITTCVTLSVVTLAVYFQTFGYGFVYYDDDRYVYDNPLLKAGLSVQGLSWAFTTFYCANWHPLTWISYLLDYQLFGINAGVEHFVNVVLHIGAVILLFYALLEMTEKPWRCAVVAGIFALHPLHVESVAWVAERKDVLSTFFQMLTLLLYARYARKRTLKTYAVMALAFALSLLAKPMAVTLPFVLLLLDVWPFRRPNIKGLLVEKIPLLAMSAVSSALTFMAQRAGAAVASLDAISFTERLANAAVAYVGYIGKALWPVDLAVLYPLTKPSAEAVLGSLLVLIVISAAAVITFRQRPYFLVGWLWYLGMLVPVIGLVQVGRQSMADRYTYMPLVGLSIALVWIISETVQHSPSMRQAAASLACLLLVAMPAGAYHQTEYWKDSETLFRHTIAVTGNNPIMEGNLGVVLAGQGKHDEAVALYRKALATDPTYSDAHANLGRELLRSGRFPEAYNELSEALRLKPDSPEPQEDMGVVLAAGGRFEESRQHLEKSLELKPDNPEGQSDLCFVLQHLGRFDHAIAACDAALKLKADLPDARFNRGNALAGKGKFDEAEAEFNRVLKANPNNAAARVAIEEVQRKRAGAPAK